VPLQSSCSLEALQANIAAEIKAGRPRDQAVAIAHSVLRASCHEEGKPTPSTKDVAGVAKKFKRKHGERTADYLEIALSEAKTKLSHRDFATIHQAARCRAGGLASGRVRTVEKGLLLGPQYLTEAELDDAADKSELTLAADTRLDINTGGEYLAQLFWSEKARRMAIIGRGVKKSEPDPGDVHIPTTRRGRAVEKKNILIGGIGDKTKPEDVDPKQLKIGIEVEQEHTNDPNAAREIALDHLTEDPEYYTKLRRIEKKDRSEDPGVMVALRLPQATAKDIAIEGGEPPEQLHVTLAYLGRMSAVAPDGLMAAADALSRIATSPILRGVLSGIGRFSATETSDGKDVLVRLVDVPGLTALRAKLIDALKDRDIEVCTEHDFLPHLTLAYIDPGKQIDLRSKIQDVYFDAIALSVNNADTMFPLGQADPLTEAKEAAGKARDQESPATVVVEECSESGEAVVRPLDGEDLIDMVAMSEIDIAPGDIVELTTDLSGGLMIERGSASVLPSKIDVVKKSVEQVYDAKKHATKVPFIGPKDAPIVFVSGAPSELELARREPLVGPDGVLFIEHYLTPLGVTKSEIAVGFACPVLPRIFPHELGTEQTRPWKSYMLQELEQWPNAVVVAVGKAAADALGDRALLWLPHPCAARLNKDRYSQQIERKIRRVRKMLDDGFVIVQNQNTRAGQPEILAGRIGEMEGPVVRVAKSGQEKQIVYGVVLDPYMIDTQNEWVPPAVVESTAHEYLKRSRVMGREHLKKDKAELVESWCVHYPTQEDYKAAMSLQPHRAYEMPFGEDKVHSGAWIVGVHLGDRAWDAYKRGEITGFSVGGFSAKTKIDSSSMPQVSFVPLVEGDNG